MLKELISKNWYYINEKREVEELDLPHDNVIGKGRYDGSAGGGENGFYPESFGRYCRYFVPEEHKKTILHVDGAYMCAEVSLNNNHLSTHPHGYTPHLTDLTDYIEPGVTNKLSIDVASLQPSVRWYSGGGVYRDVFLWTGGEIRIEPWQLFITTEQGDFGARVHANAKVSADRQACFEMVTRVSDSEGNEVARNVKKASVQDKEVFTEVTLEIARPHLWDLDDPYLYTLTVELYCEGKLTDTTVEHFGIRSVDYSPEFGFRLNGKTVKMRGGCIHHDHGVLGAACFPDAEERKIRLLKAAGFNAVRISHNPPSLALLEVCDRLGMLLMDEAFDMWNVRKKTLDYHLWFGDWWARDIADMVMRDRNHPCVMSYSIGNEILERDGLSDGGKWAHRLADEVRRYDRTRPVTSAICTLPKRPDPCDPEDFKERIFDWGKDESISPQRNKWLRISEDYINALDIVGYNYLFAEYEADHEEHPERIMWGAETHALKIWDSWSLVKNKPYVIGDFTWTAYDNLGEAGTGRACWERDGYISYISIAEYPWRTCYQGDLDLCGYRRAQSFYREIVWGLSSVPKIFTTHPMHYGEGFSGTGWHFYDVNESWTFGKEYLGKCVRTDVYTDGDEVEFFINGRSLGKAKAEKCIAAMDIPYEEGEVAVIAYKDGRASGRSTLKTVGAAEKLILESERAEIKADGRELLYVRIAVADRDNNRIADSSAELKCTVTGGKLHGIFSGDPINEDVYGSNVCHAFCGRALAIISAKEKGEIRVAVSSEGLSPAEITAKAN